MAEQFLPVLITLGVVTAFAVILLGSTSLTGQRSRHETKAKRESYESGVPLLDRAGRRISVKFYLVALVFVVLDVEKRPGMRPTNCSADLGERYLYFNLIDLRRTSSIMDCQHKSLRLWMEWAACARIRSNPSRTGLEIPDGPVFMDGQPEHSWWLDLPHGP